jgi:CheY-like chemotaxis protein
VVHGIVKAYGGDIKVYSEPGKGATFNVYIPLKEKTREDRPSETVNTDPVGSERILLVDDEAPVGKMQKMMLERLGYQVTCRSSSTDALEAFRSKPDAFDLVITDMTMPNMTGDQLARKILLIRPDIPVVISTGFSDRINKEKSDALGIKGLLKKPILKSDMAKTVRKVLDKANG